MSKPPKKGKRKAPARQPAELLPSHSGDFDHVLRLIDAARGQALAAVNTALIDLYWQVGEYISRRIAAAGWGQGTVQTLAEYIRRRQPSARGFSAPNLWRMRQFFEAYGDQPKLSALLRELTWTHNVMILGKCKRPEEREFYLRLSAGQKGVLRTAGRAGGHQVFHTHGSLSSPLVGRSWRGYHG